MLSNVIFEAMKNNLGRFPDGCVLVLTKQENGERVEKFGRFKKFKHSVKKKKS